MGQMGLIGPMRQIGAMGTPAVDGCGVKSHGLLQKDFLHDSGRRSLSGGPQRTSGCQEVAFPPLFGGNSPDVCHA
jgi:hypothetical protein